MGKVSRTQKERPGKNQRIIVGAQYIWGSKISGFSPKQLKVLSSITTFLFYVKTKRFFLSLWNVIMLVQSIIGLGVYYVLNQEDIDPTGFLTNTTYSIVLNLNNKKKEEKR